MTRIDSSRVSVWRTRKAEVESCIHFLSARVALVHLCLAPLCLLARIGRIRRQCAPVAHLHHHSFALWPSSATVTLAASRPVPDKTPHVPSLSYYLYIITIYWPNTILTTYFAIIKSGQCHCVRDVAKCYCSSPPAGYCCLSRSNQNKDRRRCSCTAAM